MKIIKINGKEYFIEKETERGLIFVELSPLAIFKEKIKQRLEHHQSETKRHFEIFETTKSKKQLRKHLRHKFIADELEGILK